MLGAVPYMCMSALCGCGQTLSSLACIGLNPPWRLISGFTGGKAAQAGTWGVPPLLDESTPWGSLLCCRDGGVDEGLRLYEGLGGIELL